MSNAVPGRRFEHSLRIAGYNRSLYAAASVAIIVAVALACLPLLPDVVRWMAAAGAAVAAWYAAASFLAFHWMFDRSGLRSGRWLNDGLSCPPVTWVQINSGLEETSAALHEVFADAEGKMLDVYDPRAMTESAITRARQKPTALAATPAPPDALPVEDGWADLVLVMLAAHEIRNKATREDFYRQLARIVSADGRVVVVEHLRDLCAALAFGPGFFHFMPRREWLRLGTLAGLELVRERPITPFIRVFVYRRKERASAATNGAADAGT